MATLLQTGPRELRDEYYNRPVAKYFDRTVVAKYRNGDPTEEAYDEFLQCEVRSWPGPQKNVHVWWLLEDNVAVGWNENPARGWSFPIVRGVK